MCARCDLHRCDDSGGTRPISARPGGQAPATGLEQASYNGRAGAVESQGGTMASSANGHGRPRADAGRESFGALLRRHRLAANLTQEELASRAGLTAQAISMLERDVRRAPRSST